MFYFLCSIFFSIHLCIAFEIDLTIEVGPGKRECFHQPIKSGVNLEVEFQVIDGGDLDLNFVIQSPTGRVLISVSRKTESLHKLNAGEDGDYIFCLDNTFSRFSEKLVFFELITDEDDDEVIDDSDYQMDSHYEMKVEDFRKSLSAVKEKLEESIQTLKHIRTTEAKDRALAENNFERVNLWAGIELFVLISVALVQVLMIHSLFLDKPDAYKRPKVRT